MSDIVNNFVDKILPGNYWITKSMEFSKVTTSGTLWYLKKWIVYYDYLFMKETITGTEYKEIESIFNDFISSLPENENLRNNAEAYFFDIDIRDSDCFITLNDFLNNMPNFATEKEQIQYKLSAKKFYFTYIMNLGGQSGYKKDIKDWIINKNSYFNTLEKLKEKLGNDNKLSEFKTLVADFHATLRNERQIFFYYGLFHGSEKADLTGFYNLTNIGKSILNSSFDELLLIWEHQKIKMLSQSPLTDIQKLNDDKDRINVENFNISFHPYVSLLEVILNNNAITLDEYQYVISRVSELDNIFNISENISNLSDEAKSKVNDFNRIGDKKEEDFKKELAKFILGISDMDKDEGCNYFAFLTKYTNKKVSIMDKTKGEFILKNYKYIINYLNKNYIDKYKEFQNSLKNSYQATLENNDYNIDISVKYEWSKYIINLDKNIYLSLIYILISVKANNYNYSLNENNLKNEFNSFKNILKSFGIKRKSEFVSLMIEIQETLSKDSEILINMNEDYSYKIVNPIEYGFEIDIEKLTKISLNAYQQNIVSRKRDSSLIQNLKTFYFTNYLNSSNLLKCDCCQETTFKTTNNYPYIEFHHLIPFSTDNGPDHYLNLFGLCPNCHRKMHFLNVEDKNDLYNNLFKNNNLNMDLISRVNLLLEQGVIEPIHLEFLLKEGVLSKDKFEEYMNGNIVAA
jgi:5-methylcytosine-specific restriction endonuclease McrA